MFRNQVVKFALLKESSSSPKTACQSSLVFIGKEKRRQNKKGRLAIEDSVADIHRQARLLMGSFRVDKLWIVC